MSREAARGKIIFDMDGVITGEDRYWDAAALTVWELLYSERYLGLERRPDLPAFKTGVSPREITMLRRIIFQEERVIAFFKQRAVNSNWDLAFLTFVYQLLYLCRELKKRGPGDAAARCAALLAGKGAFPGSLQELARHLKPAAGLIRAPEFDAVLSERTNGARGEELLAQFFTRLTGEQAKSGGRALVSASPLWLGVRDIFQEWYLGEEKYKEIYGREAAAPGKKGLIHAEASLLPVEEIDNALRRLLEQGWVLGIATGRPWSELRPPLEAMGIRDYFERTAIVTCDHVQRAEESLQEARPGISLHKPHPFSFLKAYWGSAYSDRELAFSVHPTPPPGRCWAVGDSLADLLAAREMGAFFIGVLTGPRGVAAGSLFQREGARLVLPDITYIPDCLSVV